jgi:hypothetical protein
MSAQEREREILDEPPPFLGTWANVYRFVILYLAAIITLFSIFTAAYRP